MRNLCMRKVTNRRRQIPACGWKKAITGGSRSDPSCPYSPPFFCSSCPPALPPSLPPSRMFLPSWWPRRCPCPWRFGATGSWAHAQSTPWLSRPRQSRPTGTTPSPSGARSSSSALPVSNLQRTVLWVHAFSRSVTSVVPLIFAGTWPTKQQRTIAEGEYLREANLYWVEWKIEKLERWGG